MQGRCALIPQGADAGGDASDFRLRGTDLRVDSGSVSSEWTSTDEEGAEAAPAPAGQAQTGKKRCRVRTWRIKCNIARPRDGGGTAASSSSDSDSSSSGSSSTSSGSSSSEGGEVAKQKRVRRQVLEEWKVQKAIMARVSGPLRTGDASDRPPPPPLRTRPPEDQAPPLCAPPMPPSPPMGRPLALPFAPEDRGRRGGPGTLEWFNADKRYRCVAIAQGFLGIADINSLHGAAQHASVEEINDRKGYLAFKHRVWRFEAQLRALNPTLYNRLIGLMQRVDASKWRRLRRNSKKDRVYPEIEYIRYDVEEMDSPCFIEPHVDNKSAVTLVAMLSQRGEYIGGHSCFRRAEGKLGNRQLQLDQGDVVLFRGEKLTHWITPVTAGRRVILQIELSRV